MESRLKYWGILLLVMTVLILAWSCLANTTTKPTPSPTPDALDNGSGNLVIEGKFAEVGGYIIDIPVRNQDTDHPSLILSDWTCTYDPSVKKWKCVEAQPSDLFKGDLIERSPGR